MKIRFLSAAYEEYSESAFYYLEESPQAADGFAEEVENAVAKISHSPLAFPVYIDNIRAKILDRYPFTLYYRHSQVETVVIAVAHHARIANYWKDRT